MMIFEQISLSPKVLSTLPIESLELGSVEVKTNAA